MTDQRFHAFLTDLAPSRAPDDLLSRSMAAIETVDQRHPWLARWPMLRFAAPIATVGTVAVVVIVAMALVSRPSSVVAPSPTMWATPGETAAGPAASGTATPSPSASPSIEPMPAVDGLIGGPATCVNDGGGWSVAVPAGWYANEAAGEIEACTLFARKAFAVSVDALTEVAISIIPMRGDAVGREFHATERRELMVGGLPAIREAGEGASGPAVRYVIGLDGILPSVNGSERGLSAMTMPGAPSLVDAAAALDQVMSGFALLSESAREAAVLARITVPVSDAGVADPETLLVTADAIWLARTGGDGSHLIRVSLADDRVDLDVRAEVSAIAAGSDGNVWALVKSDAGDTNLSRVDVDNGRLVAVADAKGATDVAVGLDGIWLAGGFGIRVVDESGHGAARTFAGPVDGIDIGCGAVWTWRPDPAVSGGNYLSFIDPDTGTPRVTHKLPPGTDPHLVQLGDRCWTTDGTRIYGISPQPEDAGIEANVAGGGEISIAGRSIWNVTGELEVRRVEPATGELRGDSYRLERRATLTQPWRLFDAGSNLWVATGDALIRYDIPAD